MTKNNTPNFFKHLPPLIQAAMHGDLKTLDMTSRMLCKSISKDYPEIADTINKIIYDEGGVYRGNVSTPTPVDTDSQLNLVRIQKFVTPPLKPILNESTALIFDWLIEERKMVEKLAEINESPPSTVIFTGLPGVGKTMSASWLAHSLELELVEVDLATVVSSYLGKTGQNLRAILDYARSKACVLFLDEFDALAKKRDDRSDLGELKRIVNVLLKEIELWPSRGLLIAATNHPELIDSAIWRRFDEKIEFELPNWEARIEIAENALIPLKIESQLLMFAADMLEGKSGSDISQIVKSAKRKSILKKKSIEDSLLETLTLQIKEKWDKDKAKEFIRLHLSRFTKKPPNVFYAKLFGKTEGTIRNILKEIKDA